MDGHRVLMSVAASQRRRVTASHLLEPNHAGGEEIQASLRFGDRRVTWATNGRRHYLSFATPRVGIWLAVGRPRYPHDRRVVGNVGSVPVYLERATHPAKEPWIGATLRWLDDAGNLRLVERLDLAPGEWIAIDPGWSLASLVASGDADLARIECLLAVVDAAELSAAETRRGPSGAALELIGPAIRAALEDFGDLLETDDVLRGEALEARGPADRAALAERVGPLLAEINTVLDRLDSMPHPLAAELAALEADLHALAQAALEASLEPDR